MLCCRPNIRGFSGPFCVPHMQGAVSEDPDWTIF
jgi:hypothetical protein